MAVMVRSREHSSSQLQWTAAAAGEQVTAAALQLQSHLCSSSWLQLTVAAVLAGVAAAALQLLRRQCSGGSSSRLQWGQ